MLILSSGLSIDDDGDDGDEGGRHVIAFVLPGERAPPGIEPSAKLLDAIAVALPIVLPGLTPLQIGRHDRPHAETVGYLARGITDTKQDTVSHELLPGALGSRQRISLPTTGRQQDKWKRLIWPCATN